METFISKLQYKTCEAGEYYAEAARDLDETLELINNFPWYTEQFAEVDLTGPSVTIRDAKNNYLKVGMYYGGRFCLYYLDHLNYYCECYPLKFDELQIKIREFFDGKLNLKKFHIYAFDGFWKRGYFTTHKLEYSVNTWKIMMVNNFWVVFFILPVLIYLLGSEAKQMQTSLLILAASAAIAIPVFYYFFRKLYKYRGQHLHISRGNNVFTFGETPNEVKEYDKKNIASIRHYIPKQSASPDPIEVFDIIFKDGGQIRFTNALISYTALNEKFASYWKLDPVDVRENVLTMI